MKSISLSSNRMSHEPTTTMKTNEEDVTRWLDGVLDEPGRRNLDATAAADPELAALRDSSREIRGLLRGHCPAELDVAGPELFMHQLARRLDAAGTSTPVPQPATGPVPAPRPAESTWVRWLAPLAAAAAVVVLGSVVLHRSRPDSPSAAPGVLLSSYAPDPNINVDARYVEEEDAVVFVLDGLPPIKDSNEVAGFRAGDPRPVVARLGGAGNGQGERHRHGWPSDDDDDS